jgi:hypothetical protein
LLLLLTLKLSACQSVTIKEKTFCTVAGQLIDGAFCSHQIEPGTFDLTAEQLIAFLEAAPAVPATATTPAIPAKGAGVVMSLDDFTEYQTELETACRILGKNCSEALQNSAATMKHFILQIKKRPQVIYEPNFK